MIKKLVALNLRFLSNSKKIPRPRDPAIPDSFQTKLTDQQVKILIDPKGFMSAEDKQFEQQNLAQLQLKKD